MIRDFKQKEDLNYHESFLLIIKLMSYKVLLIIAVVLNRRIERINIKIAFLYDLVNEKVYVKQLSKSKRNKKYAYRLNKTLYYLK